MPHPFPPHFGSGYFNPALITDNPFVAYLLIFATGALKIFSRAEYSLAEKPVPFWFQGAVIDSFWLGYLTVGPAPDLLR
ncbi:hypothetical protein ES708_22660 [subsurface metagenome]